MILGKNGSSGCRMHRASTHKYRILRVEQTLLYMCLLVFITRDMENVCPGVLELENPHLDGILNHRRQTLHINARCTVLQIVNCGFGLGFCRLGVSPAVAQGGVLDVLLILVTPQDIARECQLDTPGSKTRKVKQPAW